nr:hypothetical protein [Tanacetum cinerariifolium]
MNASIELDSTMKPTDGSTSPTSLENKIHEIENQMLEGKLVFLDDDVKQLKPNIGSEHGIGDEVFKPETVTSEWMNFESTNNFEAFNSTLHVEVEQRENGPQIISASISFARVGRLDFACALIDIKANCTLKDTMMIAIPFVNGLDSYLHTIKVKYEWKLPRCDTCSVFGYDDIQCPKIKRVNLGDNTM